MNNTNKTCNENNIIKYILKPPSCMYLKEIIKSACQSITFQSRPE